MATLGDIGSSIFNGNTPRINESSGGCNNSGVTDRGIANAENIISAARLASTVVSTVSTVRIAKLQYDTAKAYADLAKEARDYYKNFFQPLERDILTEADDAELYRRTKDDLTAGQMQVSFKASTARAVENQLRCTSRYCTGQRKGIIYDFVKSQASAEAAIAGLAYRYEQEREKAYNDLIWSRREEALKIGRDLQATSLSFAEFASGVFGSLGSQSAKAATGALGSYFYERNAQAPRYPEPIPGFARARGVELPDYTQPKPVVKRQVQTAPEPMMNVTKIRG